MGNTNVELTESIVDGEFAYKLKYYNSNKNLWYTSWIFANTPSDKTFHRITIIAPTEN